MTDLSPVAQAVWTAFNDTAERVGTFEDYGDAIAAALRAVADQVVPELPRSELGDPEILKRIWGERRACRAELLAIATELEAQP